MEINSVGLCSSHLISLWDRLAIKALQLHRLFFLLYRLLREEKLLMMVIAKSALINLNQMMRSISYPVNICFIVNVLNRGLIIRTHVLSVE